MSNRSNDHIIVTLIIITTIIMRITVTIMINDNDTNGNDACDKGAISRPWVNQSHVTRHLVGTT